MTEAEWLAKRKRCVTATEVGSILGVNRWCTANQMWKEKANSTFNGNAYTIIGQWLEPVVVEATNMKLGTDFKLYEGRQFFTNDELKLGATPDAHWEEVLLECKTTKPANYLRYQAKAPEYYIAQLATQMMLVPDIDYGYLSIMSTNLTQYSQELNLPLVIYKVERDELLERIIKEEVERFWTCVDKGQQFRSKKIVKDKVKLLCRLNAIKIDYEL